jgi:hypothetical protein
MLPLKLDEGEAKNVPIVLRFEASGDAFENSWYSGPLELSLVTTAGTVVRTTEFHIRGILLNQRLRRQPGT